MADPTKWIGGDRLSAPNVPFNKGYNVYTTSLQASERGANAWLTDLYDNSYVKLWVHEIATDLSISGTTGQSGLTRDFYPHNFTQMSFAITCQSPGQEVLGKTAEFVHKAQRNNITQNSLMRITIPSGGIAAGAGMKGRRSGLSLLGYIMNMPRIHTLDPAPDFTFNFTVSSVSSGFLQEQPYVMYNLATWNDIVQSILQANLLEPPHAELEEAAQVFQDVKDVAGFLGDILGG